MMGWVSYGAAAWRSKAAAVVLALLSASPLRAEAVDLLALGDSLTAGYGLREGEGFVPQLQAWLTERGHDVVVTNGGVSGDTTAGGLRRVEWSLTPETDGMIVALGGNDLLRGIDPAESQRNLAGILDVAKARDLPVLLVGLSAPGNYGPDYQQRFDAMYPELARDYDTLYAASFFEGLTADGATPAEARRFMQADGIHPNAEGVKRIVAALGPRVEALIAQITD